MTIQLDKLSGQTFDLTIATGTTSQYLDGTLALQTFPTVPTNTNQLTNGAGFLTSESESAFNASPAKNITSSQVTVLSNTSGTNTGDETTSTILSKIKTSIATTASQSWSTSNTPISYADGSDTYLLRGNLNGYKPKVLVFGSSVASGFGATNNQGWAYKLGTVLTGYGFEFKNYSISGNTSQNLIDRFYTDITPEHPHFLVIALSLYNEGLIGGNDETIYTTYVTNMKKLIQMCKMAGITPIITNCYPNNGYNSTHYRYIKQFNSELASWDVASVDFLGVLDDGTGKYYSGIYYNDGIHPNDTGHEAMFRAFPSSIFKCITGYNDHEKYVKNDGFITYTNDATTAPITFTPSEQINSFSFGFTIKPNVDQANKCIVSIGAGVGRFRNSSDIYQYVNNAGSGTIVSTINSADLQWHRIMLIYNNIAQTMTLYIDGVLIGSCAETVTPATLSFILAGRVDGSSLNPTNISYKDLVVYRTCLTADKVLDDFKGKILNSSLELYSPLNDSNIAVNTHLINLAPTSEYAVVNSSTVVSGSTGSYICTNSGTNTGDQTIILTGDVTGSGTGSFATTIANNAVTNAKSAQMGANTYKGNATGSTANASDVSTNTAFNQNFETSTSNIKMNGSVSVGSSSNIARADHIHASDTSKASIDLSNLSATGKEYGSSLGKPSTTNITVTLASTAANFTTGSTYTAPANGRFWISSPGTSTGFLYFSNQTTGFNYELPTLNGIGSNFAIECRKNDVIFYSWYGLTANSITGKFFYDVGEI